MPGFDVIVIGSGMGGMRCAAAPVCATSWCGHFRRSRGNRTGRAMCGGALAAASSEPRISRHLRG